MYEYTKPRGPVAAMYSSPGPCYALPGLVGHQAHDPRSPFNRGPAYTFGSREKTSKTNSSPGPCYAFDSKLYHTGKDGAPRFSVRGRSKEPVFVKTPGPGTHDPEKSDAACHHKAPAYSFGGRHQLKTSDNIPGPNVYRVPQTIGRTVESNKRQAPSYSVKSRNKRGAIGEDLKMSPGPAAYAAVDTKHYKHQPPGYSIPGRGKEIGDKTNAPGPGAHDAEKVWIHRRQQPRASFGIRHSAFAVPLIVPSRN